MKIKDFIRIIIMGLKDSFETGNMPEGTIAFKEVVSDFDTFFKKEEAYFKKINSDLTKDDLKKLQNDGKELNELQNKIEEECMVIAKRDYEAYLSHMPEHLRKNFKIDKSNLEKQKNVLNAFGSLFSSSMVFLNPIPKKIINEKYLGCDFFEFDDYTKCLLEIPWEVTESQYKAFTLILKRLEIAFKLRRNFVTEEKAIDVRILYNKLESSGSRNLFDEIYSYDKLKDTKEICFDDTKEDLILIDFINLMDILDENIVSAIIYAYFYKYKTQNEIISEKSDRGLKDLTPLIELIKRRMNEDATIMDLTYLISDVASGKIKFIYKEKNNNIK